MNVNKALKVLKQKFDLRLEVCRLVQENSDIVLHEYPGKPLKLTLAPWGPCGGRYQEIFLTPTISPLKTLDAQREKRGAFVYSALKETLN